MMCQGKIGEKPKSAENDHDIKMAEFEPAW